MPKALLFLQLLIAFITRSVVNVRIISNGSLVTTLVSLEEVCLPSFELLVELGMVSTKSLHYCRVCTHIRFWMALFNLGRLGEVGSLMEVISCSISAGTGSSWSMWRPVGVWCDAALSRTVQKISPLGQSVERECLLRASSTSCLYLSQLAFFRFT